MSDRLVTPNLRRGTSTLTHHFAQLNSIPEEMRLEWAEKVKEFRKNKVRANEMSSVYSFSVVVAKSQLRDTVKKQYLVAFLLVTDAS